VGGQRGAPIRAPTNTHRQAFCQAGIAGGTGGQLVDRDGTTGDQKGLNDGTLTGWPVMRPGLYGQAFNFQGGWLTVLAFGLAEALRAAP